MENFSSFDKINIPIYICDRSWRIVFRNHACKKFTKHPRTNSDLSGCFIDKSGTIFPEEGGSLGFIACFFDGNYKSALCIEYRSYAVVLIPTLIEFDLLLGDVIEQIGLELAGTIRNIFDRVLGSETGSRDKYGVVEKLWKYILSSIENYVSLSMFDTVNRVRGSFQQIYSYFERDVTIILKNAGCRIETDLSGLGGYGDNIYTDTSYFASVLASFLLFAVSISTNKDIIISSELMGSYVRNSITFTCGRREIFGKQGDTLKDFMTFYPEEYLNVMPYDELCRALGWRLSYSVAEGGRMNAKIVFDIDNDSNLIFRSRGSAKEISAEDIVSSIVANAFLAIM